MNYIKTGKIVAVYGLKGMLVLKHELGKKSALKDVKAIFIEERKSSMLPWFIEEGTVKSETETLLKLEGVDTREKAATLRNKEIWLTDQDYKRISSKSAPARLLGFSIINYKEKLGEVLEVIEQPHQLLVRIEMQNREILIPINETFLKKTDHKKKEIILELPDGLLDVYLK